MWRERFSGQSSPASAATPLRGFSPAPRRSSQLSPAAFARRPGLTQRTSSLSAASFGTSSESLPVAPDSINGIGITTDWNTPPPTDVPDPLEVLQTILGAVGDSEPSSALDAELGIAKPANVIDNIDFGGASLEEFANAELHSNKTPDEGTVVDDFEKEKDRFDELHRSILVCDEVLDSVQSYLTSFQSELAAVSSEIEHLQKRSTALNNKLQNRQSVEALLRPEVETLIIAPRVVRKISEGSFDESWILALHEVERKSKAIDSKIKEGDSSKALEEIKPFLDDLGSKAVERIRDYVVAQIKALRSPSINAQLIQRNRFLHYKDAYTFLARRQPQLASEISQAYNNTMHWYYGSHFTRYKLSLEKLTLYTVDQTDSIGGEGLTRRSNRPHAAPDPFSIGRRAESIRMDTESALTSFAAEESKGTHFLEIPFRAFNLALIDNASDEYSFLTEFFSKQPLQMTSRQFLAIFKSTFALGQSFTKQLIETSFDAVGVLLCVRINQRLAFELQRRKVPAVETYVNGTNMLLWPRFQQIMDVHCESIRKATTALLGKPSGSALSLTSSTPAAQTTAPHPLTQRFANFAQSILALSGEAGDDEPVSNSLGRLRIEFGAFLIKLSKSIAESKKRDRFLYNNYSLIGTILSEAKGKLAEEFRTHFDDLRDTLKVDPLS